MGLLSVFAFIFTSKTWESQTLEGKKEFGERKTTTSGSWWPTAGHHEPAVWSGGQGDQLCAGVHCTACPSR